MPISNIPLMILNRLTLSGEAPVCRSGLLVMIPSEVMTTVEGGAIPAKVAAASSSRTFFDAEGDSDIVMAPPEESN